MRIEGKFFSRTDNLKLVFYAALIGCLAAVFSLFFNLLIDNGSWLIGQLLNSHHGFILLVPVIVYALLAMSNRYLKPSEMSFGIQAVERELEEIDRQLMKPRAVSIKFFNTLITQCVGFAVGQFGPTAHLGGAIGSNIGYYGKFSKEMIRILIGCGVAAAISALMQTPLFAAIFVIEVIFAKRYFDYMFPILLASLLAASLNVYFWGHDQIISFGEFNFNFSLQLGDWLWLAVFALCLGIIMALYALALNYFSELFQSFKNKKISYLLLAIGFMLLYYHFPLALFTTPTKIVALLSRDNGLQLLAVLLLATAIQLGSGVYGGSFSPSIIIALIFAGITHGALLGANLSQFNLQHWLAFAIVGAIGGFGCAPVAAVVLALELTGEIAILVPAIAVALISYFAFDLVMGKRKLVK